MRLLFINYEFPPLGGGAGQANARIAREMATMGHDVVVLTSAYRGLPREEELNGFRIVRIPTLRFRQEKCGVIEMAVFMLSSIFFGVRLARKFRPHVSISFFSIPSGPAAWAIKKICSIPYIVSLRGGDVPGFMPQQLWFYHRVTAHLIRFIWKGAHAVVANSEGLKTLALRTARDLAIEMIPNGVDVDFFSQRGERPLPPEAMRAFFEKEKATVRLLSVGRFSSQKAIDQLLIAFARLKEIVARPVQLWIVGDGPQRRLLERMIIDFSLEDSVFLMGWRDRDTLRTFYSTADCFVLPSLDEGMPNALLEAMAAGLPIVATHVAGSSELVTQGVNGLLVPPGAPQELAEALISVVTDDTLRARMATASREKVMGYNWREVAAGYLRLCQSPIT